MSFSENRFPLFRDVRQVSSGYQAGKTTNATPIALREHIADL
jgi:hypothetical protein